MKVNIGAGSTIYRVWRDSEKINAMQYTVVECEDNNIMCQDTNGDYYKFNYFEDGVLTDRDVANQMYVLYKQEFRNLKNSGGVGDKEDKTRNQYNTPSVSTPKIVTRKRYAGKNHKNIFDIMEEQGFKSHQLTAERTLDKLHSMSKPTINEVVDNQETNKQIDRRVFGVDNKNWIAFKNNPRSFNPKDSRKFMPKVVGVGSRVGIVYAGDDEVQYYTIVKDEYTIVPKFASGSRRNKLIAEKQSKGADTLNNEITENSPIAKAIMGRTRGERFAVNVKGAKSIGSIVSIE